MLTIVTDGPAPRVERIAERRLQESPYYFLRALWCEFDSGALTLHGRVPYRQLKHLAERIVARVEGVEQVINRVEVCDPTLSEFSPPAVRNAG